uniref:C2H2-type domain-containing protein n=1 Tax=Sphaeramia orbicularis TaxID=375764 RepID=A0A673CG97_9TELE
PTDHFVLEKVFYNKRWTISCNSISSVLHWFIVNIITCFFITGVLLRMLPTLPDPEDFLQHQGEHFLGQDKESGEAGVMSGFEEVRGREEPSEKMEDLRLRVAEKKATVWAKPQQCELCNRTFTSVNRLAAHKRAHVTERSFVCGICGKSFKKQIHVRNHIRTHTGERPFQCSDCGKTFSSLANLMRHNLIHSGVRPYRCEVCHRSFSQSSNLRQHSLLHSSACLCCSLAPLGI